MSPRSHAACAVAVYSKVRPPAVTRPRKGAYSAFSIFAGSMGIRTSPQSPIQMAGWRVRMKPMSASSAELKLSWPTRLRRVMGTMWNDPNGTPV